MGTNKNQKDNRSLGLVGLSVVTLVSLMIAGGTKASPSSSGQPLAQNDAAAHANAQPSESRTIKRFKPSPRNSSSVAPVITAQPAGKTVAAGQSATFSVADTGTAPLAYQWRKNGVAISGATSSIYATPAALSSDNGSQFTVTVSNTEGTATSSAAVLTVSAPTLILSANATSINFGSVPVSTDGVKTVTLTNGGTGSVTISGLSVSGPGFNASGISSGIMLAPGQSAALTATFAPASSGQANGSISVASNASSGTTVIALSGIGAAATTHSVALLWSASASSVIGYNVYVSTVSGGSYTRLTPTPVSTPSYTDGGLQIAQTRYYVVTAVNSDNTESAFSNQVAALIP